MKTREHWLNEAVEELRTHINDFAKLSFPERIRVSCGWPSKGGVSQARRVLGEYWEPEAAWDNVPQVFISPYVREPDVVLAILLHQLLHACFGHGKHDPDFRRAAKDCFLVGRGNDLAAGPELRAKLLEVAERLGTYDNSRLDALVEEKVDKPKAGRMLKAFCPANEDHKEDYIVRLTRKQVDIGLPICPCGKEMVLEEKEGKEDDQPEQQ